MNVTTYLKDAEERALYEAFMLTLEEKYAADEEKYKIEEAKYYAPVGFPKVEGGTIKNNPMDGAVLWNGPSEVPAYVTADEPPGRDIEPDLGTIVPNSATYDEARTALHDLVQRTSMPVAAKLLDTFNVTKLKDLDPTWFGVFVHKAGAL